MEARLAGGAQLSDSGTTVTDHLPDANEALSTVASATQGAGGPASGRQMSAVPAQVDHIPAGMGITAQGQQQSTGDSAGIETTSPGQQQSKDHEQQEADACIGAPSEDCSSPGESRADAWRPIAEGPLHSITEVACMHLLPGFLEGIGQVAMTAALLCLLHWDTLL